MAMLTPRNLKTVRFEVKGIEEYLDKIKKAGRSVDETVKQAIQESAKPIYEDIKAWAEKHRRSGDVSEGINVSEVQQEGFNFFVEVGVDTNKSPNSWHAVFTEYGTPTQDADPGIRPAFSSNKSKVKAIQKKILAQGGVPTE